MSTRKDFLFVTTVMATSALAPVAGCTQSDTTARSGYVFDAERFARTLARPARHKQCFAATKLRGGEVLDLMLNSLDAYHYGLGEGPGTLHCAAVLYHGFSASLAFNDQIWNELLIPSKIRDGTTRINAQAGGGNPYLHAQSTRKKDISVEALSARGSSFFVCHNSILSASSQLASKLNLHPHDVEAELLAGIVPYAQVVPAGVMAVNALQEAHFTYINGS